MKYIRIAFILFILGFVPKVLQAQDTYADYPLFMEAMWPNDIHMMTKLVTNVMLATPSGKKHIQQIEKSLVVIKKFQDGAASQSQAEEQHQLALTAVEELHRMLQQKVLFTNNEETKNLVNKLEQELTSAWWVQFREMKFDTKHKGWGPNLIDTATSIEFGFSEEGTFRKVTSKNSEDYSQENGKWHLMGATLYLKYDDCTQCKDQFFYISKVDSSLILIDQDLTKVFGYFIGLPPIPILLNSIEID